MIKVVRITIVLILLVLTSCNREVEVWYQGSNNLLLTEQQVDSIIEAKNKVMQDKNLDMVFSKAITDSIISNNKIIYKYGLKGESTLVTENVNSYEKMIGGTLPSFTYSDIHGNIVTSEELKGKPLVINMWFTKCPPCIAEMPELNKIKAEAKNADVEFIAMTYEDEEKVTAFLEKQNFNFQHITGAKDYCEKFTNQYPINIFVDRNGIINHIEGGMPLIYDAKEKRITDKVNPSNFISALEEIKG